MGIVVGVGSDHHGFALKESLRERLEARYGAVRDFGCFSEAAIDYPQVAFALAEAVARGEIARGILICRSGIGMAIAANKIPGVDAAAVCHPDDARAAWTSNGARVLTLAARGMECDRAWGLVEAWLGADPPSERSAAKIAQIRARERH